MFQAFLLEGKAYVKLLDGVFFKEGAPRFFIPPSELSPKLREVLTEFAKFIEGLQGTAPTRNAVEDVV